MHIERSLIQRKCNLLSSRFVGNTLAVEESKTAAVKMSPHREAMIVPGLIVYDHLSRRRLVRFFGDVISQNARSIRDEGSPTTTINLNEHHVRHMRASCAASSVLYATD